MMNVFSRLYSAHKGNMAQLIHCNNSICHQIMLNYSIAANENTICKGHSHSERFVVVFGARKINFVVATIPFVADKINCSNKFTFVAGKLLTFVAETGMQIYNIHLAFGSSFLLEKKLVNFGSAKSDFRAR